MSAMDHDDRAAMARITRRQHGQMTARQAGAAGISGQALRRAKARGEYSRVRRRVYQPAGIPLTWEAQLMADVLACLRPALAARTSVLRLYGLTVPGLRIDREVVVLGSARPSVGGPVLVHRTRVLDSQDRITIARIPSTTVERAIIDLAPVLRTSMVLRLVDRAVASDVAHRGVLHSRAHELRNGRKHVGMIADLTGPTGETNFRSELERRGAALLRRAGMRDLRFNVVPLAAPRAGVTDVVSETDRLVVDWDGLAFHHGPQKRQRDDDKANAVVLGGYRGLRFTWADQRDRPEHVIRTVAQALTMRR